MERRKGAQQVRWRGRERIEVEGRGEKERRVKKNIYMRQDQEAKDRKTMAAVDMCFLRSSCLAPNKEKKNKAKQDGGGGAKHTAKVKILQKQTRRRSTPHNRARKHQGQQHATDRQAVHVHAPSMAHCGQNSVRAQYRYRSTSWRSPSKAEGAAGRTSAMI